MTPQDFTVNQDLGLVSFKTRLCLLEPAARAAYV
jgi:hypothetical protein